MLDRTLGGAVLVGSAKGGVDIEELAESSPEDRHKVWVCVMCVCVMCV